MKIRKTTFEDMDSILALYEKARSFMAHTGNPTQWGTTYSPAAMLEQDITDGYSYVARKMKKSLLLSISALVKMIPMPRFMKDNGLTTYYGVVHRITSDSSIKGTASFCLDWALSNVVT